MFLDTHPARGPDRPHARGRPAGGHSHEGSGQLPQPADAGRPGPARGDAPERATALARRPPAAPRGPPLHERHHREAQGRGVPPRGVREPGPELRRVLRPLVPGLDATSLTSSLGYDGSISEMYKRLGVGLRRGPADEGAGPVPAPTSSPVLREAEVTVLFCPPVLLTTLTPTPELDPALPAVPLRGAGRARPFPRPSWSRGRGADGRSSTPTAPPRRAPTRAARACARGEPVTIGTPFANVTYVILEPGGVRPAAPRGGRRALHRRAATSPAGTATCRS